MRRVSAYADSLGKTSGFSASPLTATAASGLVPLDIERADGARSEGGDLMSFAIIPIRCPNCTEQLECAVPVRSNTTTGGPSLHDIECPVCHRCVSVNLPGKPTSVNKGWHA